MKTVGLHISVLVIIASLAIVSSCSTNSTCFKEPHGTYLSKDGNYEKLVFTENNRVYLYKDSQNIIYSSFNLSDKELIINTKPRISFEVLCDKTIVERNGDKYVSYYRSK